MTYKRLFFASMIQIITLTSFDQIPTCKSLHSGRFKVFSKQSGTTYIERSATEQIETNEDLGYKLILSIKWIDECTYELRPKKLIKGDPSVMGDGKSFMTTHIKNITSKAYTAETSASFSPAIMDFVVEIIK
jgi:hypothetical protein